MSAPVFTTPAQNASNPSLRNGDAQIANGLALASERISCKSQELTFPTVLSGGSALDKTLDWGF